jgi:hypothetical protein
MAPLRPYISLTSLTLVRDITTPNPDKPNSFLLYCNFNLQKSGRLTIPVCKLSTFFCRTLLTLLTDKYFENGDVPPINSYVMLSGPFWILPGTNGSIQPDTLNVVTNEEVTLNLLPPSVFAVGTVATMVERDIHLDVGAYNSDVHITHFKWYMLLTLANAD